MDGIFNDLKFKYHKHLETFLLIRRIALGLWRIEMTKTYKFILLLFLIHISILFSYGKDIGDNEYKFAFKLWENGNLSGAIKKFQLLIKNHPESQLRDNAQFMIGKCYYYKWNLNKAIEEFKKVIKIYQSKELSDKAQRWLGDSYFFLKKYDQAIIEYKKVIDNYPESKEKTTAYYQIGKCYYEKKEYKKAKEQFQLIIIKYPKDKWVKQSKFEISKIEKILSKNK